MVEDTSYKIIHAAAVLFVGFVLSVLKYTSYCVSQDQALVPYLLSFVEHFIDRFVEIACKDIDDHVALAMVEGLRAMQR